MITTRNLTKAYGDRTLFQKADLRIGNGVKVGLVGRNGCGKTTLFKVLTGVEEYSNGTIDMQGEVIGYIPQEFNFPDELVGEYLEKKLEAPWDFYKVDALAGKLNFHNFDPYQSLSTLSEGQKMKVKLIEAMLMEPTTLFIDEPTNHLDIEGIMWFEEYVKHLPIAVVMISHDRQFLNRTVDEIWEIDNGGVFKFVGDYDNYRTEKLKLIDKWDQEYVLFLKRKAQLEKLLESARKIKDGKKRGRAVESAKKRIKREVEDNSKEKYEVKKVKDLRFASDAHMQKLMIKLTDLTKYYGDKKVFEELNFELRGKEKIWLYGPNGAGKSTLVKMIMGFEAPTSGEIIIGNNVTIGYFSQTQHAFNQDSTVLNEFCTTTGTFFGDAFGYLKKFLFEKEDLQKRIFQLSPGERARFAFSIFAKKNYDLLILDEPDNHLDIETKEVIEKALREFNGAVLLISHDRYFVEMVRVNKVVNLKDGTLSYFEEE